MMRYDLSPLYRSTVGFDRLFHLLDNLSGVETAQPTYPPYNIERTGENAYRITMAVAGFGEKDITLEARESTLVVKAEKTETQEGQDVLYRGIASRSFERRFQLADYVVVKGASLENGLLHVDLERQVPEALKPRQIPIATTGAKVIETKPAEQIAA
ncbi:MAG: Hsp20 family protein [Ancalomicrobiaceae bacterium]|nr:Hsp20 family protein [Ancalomicrobiaceae bacterium]